MLQATPEKGVVSAAGLYATFTSVLVEITTDTGLVGHGEAIARGDGGATAIAVEKIGAELVKEVAKKTDDVAGDGTTTATVLA